MGTMWAAESAVVRAGGFTWSNLDCELDDGDGGPSGGVSHRELPYAANGTAPLLSACGLSKANANPRADDKAAAPVLYRGINRSLAQQHCAPWLRVACNGSVLPHVPLQMPFSHEPFSNASQERNTRVAFPFLGQDVARFRKRLLLLRIGQAVKRLFAVLVRGDFAWMAFGWIGCVTIPPPVANSPYDRDYGTPLGECSETRSGVFSREYSKATVQMDCNAFGAKFTARR